MHLVTRRTGFIALLLRKASQGSTAKVLPQEPAAKNKALRQQSASLPGGEQEDP